jgi:hypothetical protein
MGLSPRLRTSVKVALSILIAVVATEGLARGWMAVRGRSYSGVKTGQAITRMANSIGAARLANHIPDKSNRLHPFTGWDVKDGAERIARDRERFLSGRADKTYDILIIGSSVAAGLGHEGAPALVRSMEEGLNLAPRGVRVQGYGRSAYKQPQQLMLLNWLLVHGFTPDAVVCIDGFNEMALSVANGRRGVPPDYPGWGQWGPLVSQMPVDPLGQQLVHQLEESRRAAARIHGSVQRFGLANSAVLGSLYRGRMVRAKEHWQAVAEELSSALAGYSVRRHGVFLDAGNDLKVAGQTADLWRLSTELMMGLCHARDIPLLHVLQPNPSIPGSKQLSAEEEAMIRAGEEWVFAATEGYPLIRQARAELMAKGLESLDTTMIFQGTEGTVWRDAGHLNQHGNGVLGAAVAGALLDLIER